MASVRRFCWVAAAVILGASAVASSHAQATTGGCFPPSIAVQAYMFYFLDQTDQASNTQRCRRQCDAFRLGCQRVCIGAYKCFRGQENALFNSDQQSCRDAFEGPDRRDCIQNLNDNRKGFSEFLRQDKEDARDFCQEQWQLCRDSCGAEF